MTNYELGTPWLRLDVRQYGVVASDSWINREFEWWVRVFLRNLTHQAFGKW